MIEIAIEWATIIFSALVTFAAGYLLAYKRHRMESDEAEKQRLANDERLASTSLIKLFWDMKEFALRCDYASIALPDKKQDGTFEFASELPSTQAIEKTKWHELPRSAHAAVREVLTSYTNVALELQELKNAHENEEFGPSFMLQYWKTQSERLSSVSERADYVAHLIEDLIEVNPTVESLEEEADKRFQELLGN